jgi:hypothetical protein
MGFCRIVLILLLSNLFWGCGLTTVRPKLEMSYAQAAFLAATDANAANLAPNLFKQAENYYLKAKSNYQRKYFNKAKQYAILATKYSERAEYHAKKRKAMGDGSAPKEETSVLDQ